MESMKSPLILFLALGASLISTSIVYAQSTVARISRDSIVSNVMTLLSAIAFLDGDHAVRDGKFCQARD
jgi:hypothetical protein